MTPLFKFLGAALIAVSAVITGSTAAAPYLSELYRFDIPAAPAREALQTLANQTGLMIVYGSADLLAVHTNPVRGEMSYDQALHLMFTGTGLTYRIDELGGKVVILRRDAVLRR